MHLDEITNAITGNTKACFEPSIDYVVCKFPRWPFEKFTLADREIGTQMKATGEVMALTSTLEGALLKALRPSKSEAATCTSTSLTDSPSMISAAS